VSAACSGATRRSSRRRRRRCSPDSSGSDGAAAVEAPPARLGYVGAGTVEFIRRPDDPTSSSSWR
jgi:hypothetical protein